jgi:hypothetical protein
VEAGLGVTVIVTVMVTTDGEPVDIELLVVEIDVMLEAVVRVVKLLGGKKLLVRAVVESLLLFVSVVVMVVVV